MGWLVITYPNGLIGSFYRPFEGKINNYRYTIEVRHLVATPRLIL